MFQICKDGYASICPDFHYVVCNDTLCPNTCTQCEPGYVCRDGIRYICEVGTYADDLAGLFFLYNTTYVSEFKMI